MDTREYKIRTLFREAQNVPRQDGKWLVGIDIGYSSVKVQSQNALACFPSFALESMGATQISFGNDMPEDNLAILYRDENGIQWTVGALAQDSLSATDTTAGSLAAYGRQRYYSPMFLVLFRVGIAAGMRTNAYGDPTGKEPLIQTGLPPKYLNDAADFTDVMCGHHHFWVKFGTQGWQEFDITITPQMIMPIIAQPLGTLVSIATTRDMRPSPDAEKLLKGKVLIVDGGFGTLDFFPMLRGVVQNANCETDENLGMKRVLLETVNELQVKYGFECSVPAIQQYLETGKIPAKYGKAYRNTPFDDILEKHSREICYMAIDKMQQIYPLYDYQYLVITGGTCAAWSNFIREHELIKNSDTTKVVSGNDGDPSLPYIFANVRGYYIYALTSNVAA